MEENIIPVDPYTESIGHTKIIGEDRRSPMAERLTGIEAYRALLHFIKDWHKHIGDDHTEYLLNALEAGDPGMISSWKNCLREVLYERQIYGNDLHAYKTYGGVYHPCKCQEDDSDTDLADMRKACGCEYCLETHAKAVSEIAEREAND